MRALFLLLLIAMSVSAAPIKVLLIDGQNNHQWKVTSPEVKKILEETRLFTVEVSTTPDKGGDFSAWQPKFAEYAAVVSNYNGELWPEPVCTAFEGYVRGGGGFVPVHAANNSFPEWLEYNRMIGVGGWGGRSEKSGPYLRLRTGRWMTDVTPGRGGSHGKQHEFVVTTRDPEHPVTKGLPPKWKHRQDELYDRLRGPAENVTVLGSAFSDPATGGSGEEEPLLMAIPYGKGRVFHTALGHGMEAIQCVGFAVTLQRGTEWAATGKVTQKVPAEFPTEQEVRVRR
jgi:uncharacterized protein